MIKISSLLLFSSLIILFSCDSLKKETANEQNKKDKVEVKKATKKLDYQLKNFQKKNVPCVNDECTFVKVSFPKFTEENNRTKSLNEAIAEKAKTILSEYVMDANESDNLNKLMTSFISNFDLYKATFPEAKTNWFIEIEAKPTYRSEDFISVKYDLKSYSGGAHTISESLFINFNLKGKELAKLSYFFRDKQTISKIAEQEFRKSKEFNETQSLNKAGYIFPNDKFALSENFGFQNSKLIFYYNSYEIGAYSEGPTEIAIELKELKENFRF